MDIESHKRAIKESLEMIMESIQKGVSERQRTIGFHCSVAAADMLELFLHSEGLINLGKTTKHDFFTSKRKLKERLPDFKNRGRTIELLTELETKRNLLCYGKPQPEELIEEYICTFNKIRKLFEEMGADYE